MSKTLQTLIETKEAEIAAAKIIAAAVQQATELLEKAGCDDPSETLADIWEASLDA